MSAISLFTQAVATIQTEPFRSVTVTVHAPTGSAVNAVGTRATRQDTLDFAPQDLIPLLDRLQMLLEDPVPQGVLTVHHHFSPCDAVGWGWEITPAGTPFLPVSGEALYWWLPGVSVHIPDVETVLTARCDSPPRLALTPRATAVLTARGHAPAPQANIAGHTTAGGVLVEALRAHDIPAWMDGERGQTFVVAVPLDTSDEQPSTGPQILISAGEGSATHAPPQHNGWSAWLSPTDDEPTEIYESTGTDCAQDSAACAQAIADWRQTQDQ